MFKQSNILIFYFNQSQLKFYHCYFFKIKRFHLKLDSNNFNMFIIQI